MEADVEAVTGGILIGPVCSGVLRHDARVRMSNGLGMGCRGMWVLSEIDVTVCKMLLLPMRRRSKCLIYRMERRSKGSPKTK